MKAPTGKLAYAYDTIETLQNRIAELEAQLASEQEPNGEREAFEAWAVEQNYEVKALKSDGRYWSSHTHIVWEAWQARAAHPAPEQHPLGIEEIQKLAADSATGGLLGPLTFARAIEAKHGIKENP